MTFEGAVNIGLIIGGLLLLVFCLGWLYNKGKAIGYAKGANDAKADSNQTIVEIHDAIVSGDMPDGMCESAKTWSVPTDARDRVEQTNNNEH